MKPGDQIAYIPNHVERSTTKYYLDHPDIEFGFVTSLGTDERYCWCRYWRKGRPGELRTTANSELTPIENIILFGGYVDQSIINNLLQEFKA